jgi:hypothetical protein
MAEPDAERSVYLFAVGEAFDDMRPAFYVDDQAYPSPDLARVAVETAEAVMTRTGVLYGVDVHSGPGADPPAGTPTWDDFHQRHFVDGQPLPVRAQPPAFEVPQSWPAMHAEMTRADEALQEELQRDLRDVFGEKRIYLESHAGPSRYSAGSVQLSEELYGFSVELAVAAGDDLPSAFEQLTVRLARSGWQFTADEVPLIRHGRRGLFQIVLRTNGSFIRVLAHSPLYRAADEPLGEWVEQERPHVGA